VDSIALRTISLDVDLKEFAFMEMETRVALTNHSAHFQTTFAPSPVVFLLSTQQDQTELVSAPQSIVMTEILAL
jgi:hypothetical protein